MATGSPHFRLVALPSVLGFRFCSPSVLSKGPTSQRRASVRCSPTSRAEQYIGLSESSQPQQYQRPPSQHGRVVHLSQQRLRHLGLVDRQRRDLRLPVLQSARQGGRSKPSLTGRGRTDERLCRVVVCRSATPAIKTSGATTTSRRALTRTRAGRASKSSSVSRNARIHACWTPRRR